MIPIYDRRGEAAFTLGDGQTRFGSGVTNLYYQDPVTDAVEPFARKHMGIGVRLVDALESYDECSTLGILRDIDPASADLFAVLEMVANTAKPLVLLISQEKLFVPILEMLEGIHGNLGDHPFLIPYLNPVTPLVLNEGTADKLIDSIERGIPFIYSNYGMAGASTPITPAGALALLNAELLLGLVLSQLVKEGSSIILGSLPAYFDMKTMIDFLDPQSYLVNLSCAEMMAHYAIPHAGTSGSGEGWGPDLLSGGNIWLNHLTGLMGKAGLAPFVGSTLNSKAYSPLMTVYASDVIAQARLFTQGYPLNDQIINTDEIVEEVLREGHFIMSPTTLSRYRDGYYNGLFPHIGLERWQEIGNPTIEQTLRDRVQELIEASQPPDDHDEILAQGEAFIDRLGVAV
jgi:trimethylamine--corrinoid protein Co-methyltransferase